MTQQGRTTSAGTWRFSKDYLQAASIVSKQSGAKFSHPAYFLYGHSIELALKAFLIARGVSINTLRFKPYGHNLSALLKEARRRKIGQFCKFGKSEIEMIESLNQEYSSKNFEYIVTGAVSIPRIEAIQLFATHLVTSLEKYCINSTYPGMRT